jgi:biotin carboxyl carrier protein
VSYIFVKEGNRVKTGAKLCILEAMKMENEITSPKNGTVTHIHIDSGDNVEKGNLLMEISD